MLAVLTHGRVRQPCIMLALTYILLYSQPLKIVNVIFSPESTYQLCAGMHSTGFRGPYCLTFRVRRTGASERSENAGRCRPSASIIFLVVDLGFPTNHLSLLVMPGSSLDLFPEVFRITS
jgi:hypothetical protein